MPIRDDSLIARYIREIENPDSIGYKEGRWYEPDKQGYDSNNRGFGVDVIHNKGAKEIVKNRNNKWLSEEEERFLRNSHIAESQRILDSKAPPYILRTPPSEGKQAMAVGMLYRGDSVMQNPTVRETYLSGTDSDMQKAVSDYYQSKKVSERAQRHNNFFNPQKKNTSIPNSIRRPTPYTPPKFSNEQFIPSKKYDEGGYINNDWDSLSYRDKAEMMKVAIDNGITTLPEIRKAYNEFAKGGRMNWTMQDEAGYRYWRSKLPRNLRETNDNDYDMRAAYKAGMEPQWNNEDKSYHLGSRDPQSGRILKSAHHPTFLKALLTDASMRYYPTMDNNGNTYTETWRGNSYGGGGYMPSNTLRKSIANWEGASMKTNRSFEAEARDFNRVIPSEIRSKLSSNQLDALYSYGYNVGMGKLKERVLPTLTAYTQGKATKEDVQRSMWATKDSQLRGLTRRRNWEREMFGGNYRTTFNDKNMGVHVDPTSFQLPQGFFNATNAMINTEIPQMQMPNGMDIDPSTLYKAPVIDGTLFANPKNIEEEVTYSPREDRLEGIRRFNTIMGMMGRNAPFSIIGESSEPGIMQYVNAIYS